MAPIATPRTPGTWYRHGDRAWRLVSLDGTCLDVPDTPENARAFGRPGASRGASAFPQVRLVGLVETGTHVVCGATLGAYRASEITLVRAVLPHLRAEMLCLADRQFLGFDLWQEAAATGGALVWRAKKNARLPVLERLPDGSYQSELRVNRQCRATDRAPIPVRVIEYTLPKVPDAEPIYRLVTTLLDPAQAPAAELAVLYHERCEIETAFGELKTHLRGARIVLRSKTPELVRQEAYGLLLAHYAVRGLMHEAALTAERDPDTLSFTHAVRGIRRTLPHFAAFPPSRSDEPPPAAPDAPRRTARRAGWLQPRPRVPARRQAQDE